MDYVKRIQQISNGFYNLGLKQARMRDLTGSALSLKKCLHFNKYHTDARNLLGLIYYEIGETADGLMQWVISRNLNANQNRADFYLNEVQKNTRRLEIETNFLKKYNQSLHYLSTGSEDLAVLQLTKVVESKTNYIKAHLVLSLLLMKKENYQKAGRYLMRVLEIDRTNPKALYYLSMVKEYTEETELKTRRHVIPDHRRRKEEKDVIIPTSYKENTGVQTILNIITGLCLGAVVVFFLVMPAKTKAMNINHNNELLEYNNTINQKNLEVRRLNEQIATITEEKNVVQQSLDTLTNDDGSVLNQYQTLIGILQAYRKNDFNTAVKLYAGLNPSSITNNDILAIIAEIQVDMAQKGYQVLERFGDEALKAGDRASAMDYFQKSLAIKSDYWEVKYKIAVIHQENGAVDEANALFEEIIVNSHQTKLIEKAKKQRGF